MKCKHAQALARIQLYTIVIVSSDCCVAYWE